MIFLPDTNACITLLRRRDDRLIARWKAVKVTDIVLCSITVYELRYGAQRSANPTAEHVKLDLFLNPFTSLPFDDQCARRCAEVRAELEANGNVIGPHDLQIAAIALQHGLTLVTHNSREFSRIRGLKLDDWKLSCCPCESGSELRLQLLTPQPEMHNACHGGTASYFAYRVD
jgi:tRNA(fMet)-specific endonuclease VapC